MYGDHEHVMFAGLPGMRDRTIHLGGFSKDYAMTGWRIGYALGPTDILMGYEAGASISDPFSSHYGPGRCSMRDGRTDCRGLRGRDACLL